MREDKIYYRLKDGQIPNNYLYIGYNSTNLNNLKKTITSYLASCITLLEGDDSNVDIDSITLEHLLEYVGIEIEESNKPFELISFYDKFV